MRRVLLDENLPRLLKHDLAGYAVRTVVEEGWSGISNGELLQRAAGKFDVLITADQGLEYQQNLAAASCGVVVLAARSTRVADLRPLLVDLRVAIDRIAPGELIRLSVS